MINLKEAALDNENTLSVSMIPGGGRIFLLAAPAEFDKCQDATLRRKASHAMLMARAERQILKANSGHDAIDMSKTDSLFEQAGECEKKQEWGKALSLYKESLDTATQAGAASKPMAAVRAQLSRMVKALSDTDALFRAHLQLLEIPFNCNHVPSVYASKTAGKEIKDWAALSSQYFSLLKQFREGERDLFSLSSATDALAGMAEGNKAAVAALIAKRLAEVRSPARLALVTEDRSEPENNVLYTWAYHNFKVDWFAPDAKGAIRDRSGKEIDPALYDAVWIHQLSLPGGSASRNDPRSIESHYGRAGQGGNRQGDFGFRPERRRTAAHGRGRTVRHDPRDRVHPAGSTPGEWLR